MKTDRFSDIIRRKLESIRPEFTDKDWARMQETLKNANLSQPTPPQASHPFSGGVWSGQSWLLAAATVSTVVLIAYSVWQRREINTLRQTIGQLHRQSVTAPAPTAPNPQSQQQPRSDLAHSGQPVPATHSQGAPSPPNRNDGQAVRPDTVFITRYLPTPSPAKPDRQSAERLSQRSEEPRTQPYVTDNTHSAPATTRQPSVQTTNPQAETYDVSSTPSVAQTTENTHASGVIDKANTRPTEPEGIHKSPVDSESGMAGKSSTVSSQNKGILSQRQTSRGRNTKRGYSAPSGPIETGNAVAAHDARKTTAEETNAVTGTTPDQSALSATPSEVSANLELATSLPLNVSTKNWNAALAQQARRMRPARPAVVVVAQPAQTAAPESKRVAHLAPRIRAGIGGEIASHLWSTGIFTELLLGKNWVVGVGLSKATYTNRFSTDDDFNDRTQQDFRRDFARPIDKWRDIVNIDTRQVRLQLPLSVGYRIPLTSSLSLLPTASTYLNLSSSENVTYFCPKILPPIIPQKYRGYDEIDVRNSPAVSVMNNLVLGTGIEWESGHLVLQASPVLNIPLQTTGPNQRPNPSWQENTTLGARARVLFQF
ncbi:hypothetical protein [Spirosoma koreense]